MGSSARIVGLFIGDIRGFTSVPDEMADLHHAVQKTVRVDYIRRMHTTMFLTVGSLFFQLRTEMPMSADSPVELWKIQGYPNCDKGASALPKFAPGKPGQTQGKSQTGR